MSIKRVSNDLRSNWSNQLSLRITSQKEVETKVNNNPSKDSYKTVYSQPFSPTLSILGWGFLFFDIFILKEKMDNNKLIAEEIENFKLFSKYSPEKTLTENLNEQAPNYTGQYGYYAGMNTTQPQKPAQKPAQKPTQQEPITFQKKFLVDCSSNPVIIDRPTADQQNDFAQKSGLNPNTSENQQYFCSNKKMSEKLAEMSKTQKVDQKKDVPTLTWIPEKFPLKYMMQGENVKKLQQALDVKNKAGQPNITGKFYNATQLALDKKIQELGLNYNRKVGLDQTTFNDIVTPRKKSEPVKIEPVTTTNITTKNTTPTVPTQINATVPQVPVAQPVTPPEPQTGRERRQARRAARRAARQ